MVYWLWVVNGLYLTIADNKKPTKSDNLRVGGLDWMLILRPEAESNH